MLDSMSDVTRVLSAIEQGDSHAAEQLLPLVYEELRKLASQKLAQEKPGQTLQPTALVHEAYLRLVDVEKAQHWDSRRHFFAAAAEAMRRILVEKARHKRSVKHGGERVRIDFDEALVVGDEPRQDLLELDELLDQLPVNERDLFIAALQIEDPAERSAYLDKACGADAELRQRVEALLQAFAQAGSFLHQPAADAAATSDVPPAGPSLNRALAEGP